MTHSEEVEALQAKALDDYVGGLLASLRVEYQANLDSARTSIAQLEASLSATQADKEALLLEGARDEAYIGELLTEVQGYEERAVALEARIKALETKLAEYEKNPELEHPTYGTAWFYDNFDTLDLSKWNVREDSSFGKLNDQTILSKDMVFVQDSILHVQAKWLPEPYLETTAGPASPAKTKRTHKAGYIDQRSIRAGDVALGQKFGLWEFRVKADTGPGTLGALCAVWLRNNSTTEWDLFESWGWGDKPKADVRQKDGTSTTTFHNQTGGGTGYAKFAYTLEDELRKKGYNPDKVYNNFVTVSFELTPDFFRITYDGIEVVKKTKADHPMAWEERAISTPFHLRINQHIGPSTAYYGLTDPANKHLTHDPIDFQIDWIKVWKHPQG